MKKTIIASLVFSTLSSAAFAAETMEIRKTEVFANQYDTLEKRLHERGNEINANTAAIRINEWQTDKKISKLNSKIDSNRADVSASLESVASLIVDNMDDISAAESKVDANTKMIEGNSKMIEDATNYVLSEQKASVDIINGQNELQQQQLDNHEERITKTEKELFNEVEEVRGYTVTKNNKQDSKLAANRQDIKRNHGMIQDNRQRISDNSAAISQNKKDIKDLRSDFEKQSKQMSGAVAGVAAMANMPAVRHVGNMGVSVGTGYYNGETAVAVGFGYRHSENLSAQMGVSANTGNDIQPVVGAGVTYEF